MAKPAKQIKDNLLQLWVDDEFLAALDRWRAGEEGVPGRSEAVRRMCWKVMGAKKGK